MEVSKEAKATFIVGQQNNVDEVFRQRGRENLIYISKSSVVTAPMALAKLCRQSIRLPIRHGVARRAEGRRQYPFINGFKSREMHLTRTFYQSFINIQLASPRAAQRSVSDHDAAADAGPVV